MKQILEGIIIIRSKLKNLFHFEISNSNNKTEYHFHGPVNVIQRRAPKIKSKN